MTIKSRILPSSPVPGTPTFVNDSTNKSIMRVGTFTNETANTLAAAGGGGGIAGAPSNTSVTFMMMGV